MKILGLQTCTQTKYTQFVSATAEDVKKDNETVTWTDKHSSTKSAEWPKLILLIRSRDGGD